MVAANISKLSGMAAATNLPAPGVRIL